MQFSAKDYSLPIEKVKKSCSELNLYVNEKGKIDLGSSKALYTYNKCLFKILDGIELNLPIDNEEQVHLIPTAGLRRLIASIIIKFVNPLKVIEIGTGATAIMALLLAKSNVQVIASEIDEKSFKFANDHVKINNLEEKITLVKSEGGVLNYLEKFFPVDCVLSLPPYYADETKTEKKNRGFRGTDSELYSFGESVDFSIKLLQEWCEISSIQTLCVLWKDFDDLQKGILTINSFPVTTQIIEVIAGTRTRYLTIMKNKSDS